MSIGTNAAKAALLACVVVVALTACDPNMSQGPAAIRRDGAELVIAICADIGAEELYLDTWAAGNGTPTITVIEATGLAVFPKGSEITTGGSMGGLVAEAQVAPPMYPGDNVHLQILSTGSEDINAAFVLGEAGLSEAKWLHSDGRESAEPCW